MRMEKETRSERIDIRTTAAVNALLQQAALASHKDVSEFLLEKGIAAAAGTLADRRLFLLDEARWQAFLDALKPCRQETVQGLNGC